MQLIEQFKENRWVIVVAYLMVVLIWSTTPLTIKWSSEGVGVVLGLMLRMFVAAIIAILLALLVYGKISFRRDTVIVYAASAMAMYGGMMPVYWGAQHISSGLISVIFGLSPMVTGYLAWRFIQERSMTPVKIVGALAGMLGLIVIFSKEFSLHSDYFQGVIAVLLAVVLHAISAVWIKSVRVDVPALMLVAGGLLFTLPLFLVTYIIVMPEWPVMIPLKAIASILYLSVIGSIVGFVCYYFLLKRLHTSTVALITLITPVIALFLGYLFNNEVISRSLLLGASFVLLGLGLHQWGDLLLVRVLKRRKYYMG